VRTSLRNTISIVCIPLVHFRSAVYELARSRGGGTARSVMSSPSTRRLNREVPSQAADLILTWRRETPTLSSAPLNDPVLHSVAPPGELAPAPVGVKDTPRMSMFWNTSARGGKYESWLPPHIVNREVAVARVAQSVVGKSEGHTVRPGDPKTATAKEPAPAISRLDMI
jgi:hypothetical protein